MITIGRWGGLGICARAFLQIGSGLAAAKARGVALGQQVGSAFLGRTRCVIVLRQANTDRDYPRRASGKGETNLLFRVTWWLYVGARN